MTKLAGRLEKRVVEEIAKWSRVICNARISKDPYSRFAARHLRAAGDTFHDVEDFMAPTISPTFLHRDSTSARAPGLACALACAMLLAFGTPAHAQAPRADAAPRVSPDANRGGVPQAAPTDQEKPASPAAAPQIAGGASKDAIELCNRLAGTEREVCMKQARENRERAADALGATPGSGPMRTDRVER